MREASGTDRARDVFGIVVVDDSMERSFFFFLRTRGWAIEDPMHGRSRTDSKQINNSLDEQIHANYWCD